MIYTLCVYGVVVVLNTHMCIYAYYISLLFVYIYVLGKYGNGINELRNELHSLVITPPQWSTSNAALGIPPKLPPTPTPTNKKGHNSDSLIDESKEETRMRLRREREDIRGQYTAVAEKRWRSINGLSTDSDPSTGSTLSGGTGRRGGRGRDDNKWGSGRGLVPLLGTGTCDTSSALATTSSSTGWAGLNNNTNTNNSSNAGGVNKSELTTKQYSAKSIIKFNTKPRWRDIGKTDTIYTQSPIIFTGDDENDVIVDGSIDDFPVNKSFHIRKEGRKTKQLLSLPRDMRGEMGELGEEEGQNYDRYERRKLKQSAGKAWTSKASLSSSSADDTTAQPHTRNKQASNTTSASTSNKLKNRSISTPNMTNEKKRSEAPSDVASTPTSAPQVGRRLRKVPMKILKRKKTPTGTENASVVEEEV